MINNFMFNIYIYLYVFKSRRLLDNVEKYGRAGQATDGNITH